MENELSFRMFVDHKLIPTEFYFSSEKDSMDLLFGAFLGKKLIGFISYSIDEDYKLLSLGFIEVATKRVGFGEVLLREFMSRLYPVGYRVELITVSYDASEFFSRMMKKNILPVGTKIITIH